MTQQELGLFPDPEGGERNKADGMYRAEIGAGPIWNVTAKLTLLDINEELRIGQIFTSERLREVMTDRRTWIPKTTASGGVMTWAMNRKLITQAPVEWGKSVYATSNAMPKRPWKRIGSDELIQELRAELELELATLREGDS